MWNINSKGEYVRVGQSFENRDRYGCKFCLHHERHECFNGDKCRYADILDRYESYDEYDKEAAIDLAKALAALREGKS